jgi:hypothetical protein
MIVPSRFMVGAMDRRFAANEWEALTLAERIARCALLAEEALKLAENASPAMREGYLKLAEQWLDLASEMRREAEPDSN